MTMELHLVDGTFEIYRAFFGPPGRKNSEGREVGAARAFTRSLNTLVNDSSQPLVVVAFDHVIESFRNRMFEGYKTGEGIEPELQQQFELAEQAVLAMGIPLLSLIEWEADDGMATLALKFVDQVDKVWLCSPDKDLCQVVRGDHIVQLDRIRGTERDELGVREKFGVPPASIPDYLALVGDAADGIPGIPRWGAKSTATLLDRYLRLEHIPNNVEEWDVKVRGAKALSLNLEADRAASQLYRRLATLVTDIPIDWTLDDIRWPGAHRESIEALVEITEDTRLFDLISRWGDRPGLLYRR